MYDPILIEVKHFLQRYWQAGRPVLIACSGGPDSKALVYLMLEARTFFDLEIQVAHIDHGWREQSAAEAFLLKKEVEEQGLIFHLRTLSNLALKEEPARKARYEQLAQLAQSLDNNKGAQAIVLAHQMDDQAETVLKRVLEGAHLASLGGMKEVSFHQGVMLWRPLLGILKKSLVGWLQKKNISYFTDSTNLDPRYLRGRFRSKILPQLEETFGKSIVKNLSLLGERARRLEAHLLNASAALRHQKIEDIQECDSIVLEFFLREWCQEQGKTLSREELGAFSKKIRAEHPEMPIELALKAQNHYLNR